MYVYVPGGRLLTGNVKHNLEYEYDKEDIVVTNNYVYTEQDSETSTQTYPGKRIYTFKKNDSGYYLYSIK